MDKQTRQMDVAEEDVLRANVYGLLARLLSQAPDSETLRDLSDLQGDDSEFGAAVRNLAHAATRASPEAVADEYFNLFIGVGGSELRPYGSYYLTGFLNEKPLADLRHDMRQHGIERAQEVSETEDHIAALCETMAGLITGAFGDPAGIEDQRAFFESHIGCWAPRFFSDLEAAENASLYTPVGTIGRLFLDVEREAFAMAA